MTLDASQLAAVAGLECSSAQGIYLWGPPGRGKSWLMDAVVAHAATDRKKRTHFHRFFAELHAVLHRCSHDLDIALDRLLGDANLVCFDEFHVHDPADGIFVSRLLDALLRRPITVILTSNYAPAELLPNPLCHSMFEPAIARIEQSMTVLHIDGPIDYRTVQSEAPRTGFSEGRWVTDGSTRDGLSSPQRGEAATLDIAGRTITALAVRPDQVWFAFDALCDTPTAASDFLALSNRFRRWVVSGVPGPTLLGRDAAQRFGILVDVLYDASIRVDFHADVPLERFLDSRQQPTDVERLASRLRCLRH